MLAVKSLSQVLVGSILLMSQGWAADPVIERGLTHTDQDREMVEHAINKVNLLISNQGAHLTSSWKTTQASDDDIPVYLIGIHPGEVDTPAVVPSGCRCIFVSPSVLTTWIKNNSTGTGRLGLDAEHFLVFILMHEIGHIRKGSGGAVFRDGEMSQLNIEPSLSKANEEDADDFAIDTLKRQAKQDKVNNVSLTANWVILELTKISWNMQAFRTLDEFGAFAIGKPSVYFDIGYTHPNLAWRILRANDRIHQTEATRELLNFFEEARQRGANPQPLYQK